MRSRNVVGGTSCGVGGHLRYENAFGGTGFEVGARVVEEWKCCRCTTSCRGGKDGIAVGDRIAVGAMTTEGMDDGTGE